MNRQPMVRIGLFIAVLSFFTLPTFAALQTDNFTHQSLQQGSFLTIPVGSLKAPQTESAWIPAGESLQEGYRLALQSGEATLLASKNVFTSKDQTYLVTLEYSLLQGQAEIAVVALNAPNGVPDGQLAYTQVEENSDASNGALKRLHVVYMAPSGNLMPGVQASLTQTDGAQGVVVLHSLSVRPFDPQYPLFLQTRPNGSFDSDSTDLIRNINNDQGVVIYDTPSQAYRLKTEGNGQAVNLAVTLIDNVQNPDTLLLAKVQASRHTEDDGITAIVLLNDTWSAGLFINNQSLASAPETTELVLASITPPDLSSVKAVVQNGGSQKPSEISVDNLVIQNLSTELATGIQPLPEFEMPTSLAAAVFLPKNFFAGSKGSFSLTALDLKTHLPVSLPFSVELTSPTQSIPLGQGVTNGKGFASRTFTLPPDAEGSWKVDVQAFNQPLLSGQTQVKEGGVLFIETDKPIYKPGQRIQGRVVLVNNALAPLQTPGELSISDAKGIKIHKEKFTPNEYGVFAFELPLANELNFGTWKLQAKVGADIQVNKDVEVEKYVLPSFEVNVNLPKDWFLVSEQIKGAIESRFFFGKPVQGTVAIEAFRYVGTWDKYATANGRLTDGKFEFDLPAVQYVAGTPGAEGAGTLQLKVKVTDDTGHEESTDLIARILNADVVLKLIPESAVVKPGLNQELLVVTEAPDGAPLSGEVEMEAFFVSGQGDDLGTIKQTVTTVNGVGTLSFDVPAKTVMATVNANSKLQGKQNQTSTILLNAAYSPGAFYLHLRQQNEGVVKVGDTAAFSVLSTSKNTIFYDVYANGRTVFSNATEGDEILFPVTPEMSPKAQVFVYMIQENNEISADILPFDVELSAPASLTATFNAEEVKPGTPVSLTLQAEGQSMIGLAIVDESIFALAKGRLNLRNVFAELERIFMEPQIEIHEGPINPWEPTPGLGSKGTDDLLKDYDLQVIASSGLNVPKATPIDPNVLWGNPWIRKNFPPVLFPDFDDVAEAGGSGNGAQAYQEPDRVRTFFPETWVWRPDLLTDGSGQAVLDLTAPDSITTWKLHALSTSPQGIGVAEGSLRVFQDFFAEPDLPYSVIRGDQFPMRVRIFNYVEEEQTIQVTLENADDLGLQGEAVQEVVLPPNGLGSVSFTLQPKKVGLLPVSLVARSASRADAIRKDLLVEPEGIRQELVHNGILKGATEITIPIVLPVPILEPIPVDPIREPAWEIVPDSETLRVAITPSLVGQSMQGLEKLLNMPFGCGEQNMINLAPNIEVLRYLKATNQLMPDIRAQAEFFITTGYQRELTFRHSDGSFSAFGEQDDSGSLWLTAFVLNVFSGAREIRTIDDEVLSKAVEWIFSHQKDDGSWEPVGFLIHQELSGGLEGNLALSAYVTISLLEYGNADAAKLNKALQYLEQNSTNAKLDSYVLSMITYALTKGQRPSAGAALDLLVQNAIADGNGLHWEPHTIETTAYAALSLMAHNRPEAVPAFEWLSTQRNSLGGYGSTQDTVVALKAMTTAAAEQTRDLNATVEVLVDGQSVHTFTVNSDNFDVLQTLSIDPAKEITLKMQGSGTVTYQVAHAFNVPAIAIPPSEDLAFTVTYSSAHVQTDDIVDVAVTILYKGEMLETGMTIVDVSVPTGFEAVPESLEKVKTNELIKRIEQAGRKIIFYVDHLSLGKTLEFGFQVKAKYPVKVDGGTSTAYLYYDPENRTEVQSPEMVVE